MPSKGVLWAYFYQGEKQNASQYRAHCLGCIEKERPDDIPINIDGSILDNQAEEWFKSAVKKATAGSVLGVKNAMMAHLLKCKNASSTARKAAAREKGIKGEDSEDAGTDADDEADTTKMGPATKKRKLLSNVKALTQTTLRVPTGLNIPFPPADKKLVEAQFGRATISANLPFRWVENPEVIKLFLMFRATADDVIPSRGVLSGRILNELAGGVEEKIDHALRGAYVSLCSDGWDDNSRNKVTGIHAAAKRKTFLVKLTNTNRARKDGEGMHDIFLVMIDDLEAEKGCIVVLVCCDNNGGSHKGRDLVPISRPWILVAPCCSHQFNLILGDYFKENEAAADIAEQATGVIGWILNLNHTKVRVVINDVQQEKTGHILALIVANLTRWTTHFLAFRRLLLLKDSLRHAAYLSRQKIIDAQVGAEKKPRERLRLTRAAEEQCDVMESGEFWKGLQMVVDDIEPICYGMNINQSDSVRPDEVLLTFAGIFRYFNDHKNRQVSSAMKKRIEKRWKALDQPLFIFTLILNPYEGLTRFGDKANIDIFSLNAEFLVFYRRVKSRPSIPANASDAQKKADEVARKGRESQVSAVFLAYMSGTGPFAHFKEHQAVFEDLHGKDPIIVWEQYRATQSTAELADFAIMLLELLVNQAAAERSFSDLAIKKTQHRNRLKLPKLEKMSKTGADIRKEHVETGLLHERKARENHSDATVKSLLQVPQFTDLLDDLDGGDASEAEQPQRPLVRTRKDWRREMKKWIEVEQASSGDEDVEMEGADVRRKHKSWLPATLATLFGGCVQRPVDVESMRTQRKRAFTDEERQMELIQAEYSDEPLDDGAAEGSGDDFHG